MLKNLTIILFSILIYSSHATASEGPCANMAKREAIRRYKAENGTIQGSDGIGYTAQLLKHNANILDYVVTISDNNEDGEYWEVDYYVRLDGRTQACKIMAVKKGAVR